MLNFKNTVKRPWGILVQFGAHENQQQQQQQQQQQGVVFPNDPRHLHSTI